MQLEPGVELLIGLEAISEPDERGMRTVMCIINGQLRPVVVRDRSIASDVPAAEKADRGQSRTHRRAVRRGGHRRGLGRRQRSSAGQTIATIEAMKMEAADHRARRRHRRSGWRCRHTAQVEGGDLLVVLG